MDLTDWIVWIVAALMSAGLAILALRYWHRSTAAEVQGSQRVAVGFEVGALAMLALVPPVFVASLHAGESPSFWGGGIQLAIAAVLAAAAWQERRVKQRGESAWSTVGFREKTAWFVPATVLVVFGSYFLEHWRSEPSSALPALGAAVVTLVVIQIFGHAILALLHKPLDEVDTAPDERDEVAERTGSRYESIVIQAGFWSVLPMLLLDVPVMLSVNIWLVFLVLATLARYIGMVWFYRVGEA